VEKTLLFGTVGDVYTFFGLSIPVIFPGFLVSGLTQNFQARALRRDILAFKRSVYQRLSGFNRIKGEETQGKVSVTKLAAVQYNNAEMLTFSSLIAAELASWVFEFMVQVDSIPWPPFGFGTFGCLLLVIFLTLGTEILILLDEEDAHA
jgi:hypothetical protein